MLDAALSQNWNGNDYYIFAMRTSLLKRYFLSFAFARMLSVINCLT